MLRCIIAGVLAASLAGSASARTVRLESYLKDKDYVKVFDEVWLDGVFNGLEEANIFLRITKQEPLFCEPQNMVMTEDQVKSILDTFISKNKDTLAMSETLDTLLLIALKKTFPCP
jgi:hypothetical protein